MSNFDLILHGGSVIDGTGSERRLADVGIRGDRITTLGRLDPGAAREAIEGLNGQNLKGFDMAVQEMAARPTGRPRGKPRRGRR